LRKPGSRSGETPREVLGGTSGTLLVDAYSGYNSVATVSTREGAGCYAHLRRYFHESLPTAPSAQQAIELILDLYRVEHDAKERGIVRSADHLALRREKCTRPTSRVSTRARQVLNLGGAGLQLAERGAAEDVAREGNADLFSSGGLPPARRRKVEELPDFPARQQAEQVAQISRGLDAM